MKKVIVKFLVIVFFSCIQNLHAQENYHLLEQYYKITADGKINSSIIQEERFYSFEDHLFESGYRNCSDTITNLSTYLDQNNSLLKIDQYKSYTELNEKEQVVKQRYMLDNKIYVHSYQYNSWGDLLRDQLVIRSGDQRKKIIYTYEYFYLPEFTYATNSKGVRAISGYEDNYHSHWLKKTVRKDGQIIEHVERKISKTKTKFFAKLGKKFLKAIGYGPTVN